MCSFPELTLLDLVAIVPACFLPMAVKFLAKELKLTVHKSTASIMPSKMYLYDDYPDIGFMRIVSPFAVIL